MDSLEKTEYEQWKKRAGWVGLGMMFVWLMAIIACIHNSATESGLREIFHAYIPGLIITGSCIAMFLYVGFLEQLVKSQERELQHKDEYIQELRDRLNQTGG